MKRLSILLVLCLTGATEAFSFCGFFVAKAGSELFNKSSQVIIVRNGDHTVINMSSDFDGDVKDFAMVVPVPVVLKKDQIKTVNQNLFTAIDSYSAPRLAEYYDHNPCTIYLEMDAMSMSSVEVMSLNRVPGVKGNKKYKGVKIEARYEVDEYDILILSAKESNGLKNWLTDNDYALPEKAEEVLDPYIKSGMKFFVAKINLERHEAGQKQLLSPLQISFNSNKFMLPIRLGMANANGDQDMIVHAYTDKGRVECTNYRTVKMPHDENVPLFVKDNFGQFYKDVFERSYQREQGRAVFLEYAWDVSPRTQVKCDPCVGPPPVNQQLVTIGCDWLDDPNAQVYYTRLHVRYNRADFPQDLTFNVTPNKKRFQCRYVITHPASGDLNCDEGQTYLKKLIINRENELHKMAMISGWDVNKYKDYVEDYRKQLKTDDDTDGYLPTEILESSEQQGSAGGSWVIWAIALSGLTVLLIGQKLREKMSQ